MGVLKRARRIAVRLWAAVATSGLFLLATETAASAGNWGDNHVEGPS